MRRQYYYTPGGNVWNDGKTIMKEASHILVAGSTGSGKSVFLNDLIWSVLAENSPASVQFVFIDPKRVELNMFRKIPHCVRFCTEVDETISALNFVIAEMEGRYRYMERNKLRMYNGTRLYVVIDELADLMVTAKKEVFPRLQRIAQLGRAAKITLVCATQCPNRKVIPAELTLNFTHKLCLKCDTAIESRQVINEAGGESLPRYGTGILRSPDGLRYVPIPYVKYDIVLDRVRFWERNAKPHGYFMGKPTRKVI